MVGAAAGSFVNVLVWRLPRRQSIHDPRWSYCPHCETRLTLPDLIPLFSFLFLGARCRHCGARISWRYFWVEMLCAALWAVLWWQQMVAGSDVATFLAYVLFGTALIALAFIDFQHFIIPDELNVWLVVVAVVFAVYKMGVGDPTAWSHLGAALVPAFLWGAVLGTLIFLGVALFGRLLLGKDAMGHGDIKLARAVGALLPVGLALAAFGLSVVLGTLVGLVFIVWAHFASAGEEEEPQPEEPEPPGVLFLFGLLYLLWLDVFTLLLPPLRPPVDAAALRAARVLAPGWEPPDEAEEEAFEPTLTTIPFGPYLAVGALASMLFGGPIGQAMQAYLEWAGLGG
jgi:leader peptidase (prepilin peptidase)/N-methyltransferase